MERFPDLAFLVLARAGGTHRQEHAEHRQVAARDRLSEYCHRKDCVIASTRMKSLTASAVTGAAASPSAASKPSRSRIVARPKLSWPAAHD